MPRLLGNVMEWIQNGGHDHDIDTPSPGASLILWQTRTIIMDTLICYADRDRANPPAEGSRGPARVNGRFTPAVAA